MKSDVTLAYCTFPDQDTAERICRELVLENVIACANIFPPITSIYQWKTQLVQGQEIVAIMKTRDLKRETLKDRLRSLHPYENPCLVFLPIEDGLSDFLNWVKLQTL